MAGRIGGRDGREELGASALGLPRSGETCYHGASKGAAMNSPSSSTEPRIAGFDARTVAMAASLAVAVIMLVGKLGAYALTGSAAILSDALESVIHIVATGLAAFSLWFSTQPADEGHPYGHGKFAYFSAAFEGGLILMAAVGIIFWAVVALLHGEAPHALGTGLVVLGALALINLALGGFLIYTGQRTRSLVLVANGRHVLTDVWTTAGVLVGVGLVYVTGLTWLDPVVAILAGLNILWTGFSLLRQCFEGLMEKADPADTRGLLTTLQGAVSEGLLAGFHQLRHRRIGRELWVEVHLLFAGSEALTDAHERACVVESHLKSAFPGDDVVITSHLEPAEDGHNAAHPDGHAELPDVLGWIAD